MDRLATSRNGGPEIRATSCYIPDLHNGPGHTPYARPPLFTHASLRDGDHVQLPSLQRPVAAPDALVGGVGNNSTASFVSPTRSKSFDVHAWNPPFDTRTFAGPGVTPKIANDPVLSETADFPAFGPCMI